MKAFGLVLALASCVVATPAHFEERAPQCGDGCYSQVKKNQLLGVSSKAACKELFQQTVYPCTATSTSSIEWEVHPSKHHRPCGPSITTKTVPVTLTTIRTTTTAITVLAKRTALAPVCTPTTISTTTVPNYFSSCGSVAAYSSACSCIGNTHSVISKPTPTTTVYHVGCSTSTATFITTVATVYASIETDTSTITAPYCASTITATKSADGSTKSYALKYHGWGLISNPDNSLYNQDQDHTPDIQYLGDSDNDCAIIQKCANMAYSNTDEYYMFDLHYRESEWVCVQYYQGTGDSSNFDQDDPEARKVYGYQVEY